MSEKVNIKKIDHLVITTSNLKKCVSFYELLGFKVRSNEGRWELVQGDFKLNVHMLGYELEPKAIHVQTGSADLCFEIKESIEACRDALLYQHISLESDIVIRHGAMGIMKSIYLRDPDGNLIELCSYE